MAEDMILDCPYCSKPLQADDSVLGGKARCPFCGQKFLVDESGNCLAIDKSVVACPICSKEITIYSNDLEKKLSCPICGGRFVIEPQPPPPEPPPEKKIPPVPAPAFEPKKEAAKITSPPSMPKSESATPVAPTGIQILVNWCILGVVVCFTLFCAFQAGRICVNWKTFSTAGQTKCSSCLRQLSAACCLYAQEHNYEFPPRENWQEAVKPYLTGNGSASAPCMKGYRYLGAGKRLSHESANHNEHHRLIVCDTHGTVVSSSGEIEDYMGDK